MTSGTESETRQQLDEDLDRQTTRMAELAVATAELSAKVAKREALTKIRAAAHGDVAAAKAEHEALEARKHDAYIDGAAVDPTADALEIQASAAKVAYLVGCLTRVTVHRLPAANIEVLKAEKSVKTLALDLKIIEGRIHNGQLLLAAVQASEVGGDITIKSAVAQRIGLEEAQCASELEQASRALEAEIEHQQKIRDASAHRGPVSWTNPS